VEQVWVDTLGYAGSAMIRRIVGLAHALELDAIE
jgi:5-methylthioribose kinase